VSVASRTLALLGAFDTKHTSLTLSDLARRADLPVATAHRLAGELVAWGALARTPSGGYEIGLRVWDLGLLAPVPSRLRQLASPFLQDLYAATLATVHLGVRDGTHVLYLDRLSGSELPPISHVGARLPLHTTGMGKVLLAHAPEDVLGSVLANLTRVTRYTITDPDRLEGQLRSVRSDGYAYTREEMSLGACSLAVPVRDRDGTVVAALGVTVSSLDRNTPRLVAALTVSANGIRRSLAAHSD
jgi:DNA-binding IclR family transcriptional regulator